MVGIDIEQEKVKYQAELNQFIAQLQQLDQQRSTLLQAIAERQGILGFIAEISEDKDEHKEM